MNSAALEAGSGFGSGPGKPAKRPWQNLYFFPLLHGQGWLRPILAIGVQVFVARRSKARSHADRADMQVAIEDQPGLLVRIAATGQI
jgi:hypothetical protein